MKTAVWTTIAVIILVATVLAVLARRHRTIPDTVATVMAEIPFVCPDNGAVYHQVSDATSPRFGSTPNWLSVWSSRNYDEAYWNPEIAKWQADLDNTMAWSDSLSDPCVRKHYRGWLNFYGRQLQSARNELRYKTELKNMNQYESDVEKERLMIQGAPPIPLPPWKR